MNHFQINRSRLTSLLLHIFHVLSLINTINFVDLLLCVKQRVSQPSLHEVYILVGDAGNKININQ